MCPSPGPSAGSCLCLPQDPSRSLLPHPGLDETAWPCQRPCPRSSHAPSSWGLKVFHLKSANSLWERGPVSDPFQAPAARPGPWQGLRLSRLPGPQPCSARGSRADVIPRSGSDSPSARGPQELRASTASAAATKGQGSPRIDSVAHSRRGSAHTSAHQRSHTHSSEHTRKRV